MKLQFVLTPLITLAAVVEAGDAPRHLRRLEEYYRDPLDCGNDKKQTLKVKFKSDNWPKETAWWVTNENGKKFFAGWKYTDANIEKDAEMDVCEGREYTFHISDTYKDGICCSYGHGFYKLLLKAGPNEKQIKQGGQFQDSETYKFLVPITPDVMDPVPFDGWDGKKCLTNNGNSLQEGKDYKSKNGSTLRKCMTMACEDEKVTGLDYSEDENGNSRKCKLLNVKKVVYEDEPGELCYMKKT